MLQSSNIYNTKSRDRSGAEERERRGGGKGGGQEEECPLQMGAVVEALSKEKAVTR